MDEEITCAICQKSLDNGNNVVTLREKGSEEIKQAESAMTWCKLFQVRRYTKHAAANTTTYPSYINRAKKKERENSISSRRSLDCKTEQEREHVKI